jgi:hypothetical protein
MRIERKVILWAILSGIEFVFVLLISAFFLMQGFHLISLPFLFAWACVYWSPRQWFSQRRALYAWLIFFATLFIPIDVDVAGWYHRRGQSPGGIHFVRTVPGLPMHTLLIQKYGEYISTGCCAGGLEPRWVLVWH